MSRRGRQRGHHNDAAPPLPSAGGNAAGDGRFTSEMFPDLHHKMSKKIAQLTKVIYHLNQRNEDFQSELQNERVDHQSEVEEILQDAASKINAFKAKLEDAARNTLQKDKRINIRISSRDLERLQMQAAREGVPYQTYIASSLHKLVSGRLKENV